VPSTTTPAVLHRSSLRRTLVGVGFVVAAFTFAAGFAAVTLPWAGSSDAYEHLDYIYQLSMGQLPAPVGHVFQPEGWSISETKLNDTRQFASAHPPLFYWICSLLLGGLLASEHWELAVAILRGVNILIGIAGVLVMAWGGWALGGRWRAPLAIAIPAIGAFTYTYLRFSGEIYGDMILTVVSIASIIVAALILRDGVRPHLLVAITLLGAAGMGLKATYIVVLGLACGAIVVGYLLHNRSGRTILRVVTALALAALPAVAAALAWGWFYLRNIELSGSWYRSSPKEALPGRTRRSMMDNLLNPDFYSILPGGLFGRWAAEIVPFLTTLSILITVGAGLATIIVWVRMFRNGQVAASAANLWIIALLFGHIIGSYAMQLSHATGYGAYNWRYFLPTTFSMAVAIVSGIIAARRARAVLIPALTLLTTVLSMLSFLTYSIRRFDFSHDPGQALTAIAAVNGLPVELSIVLASLAVMTIPGIGIALWSLRASEPSADRLCDKVRLSQ